MMLPPGLDAERWIARWDDMQDRLMIRRRERLELMADLVAATQPADGLVVDLGCGTGTLSESVLTRAPGLEVLGIDVDPTLLALAERRLQPHGDRARTMLADIRGGTWPGRMQGRVRAVVSSAALHWLNRPELGKVYRQAVDLLEPGGILLNADPVAAESPEVQQLWARQETTAKAEWIAFWGEYLAEWGPQVAEERERALGEWRGNDDGYPMAWHFRVLSVCEIQAPECYWRDGPDAIIGGLRTGEPREEPKGPRSLVAKPRPAW